jgi:uncharacterized protein (TIGR03118 family)
MNSILRTARLARHAAIATLMTIAFVACGGGGDGGYGGGGGGGGTPPSAYTLSKLVSDGWTTAVSTDARLRNPWGIAALPTGPFWLANNGDHSSTVYDGTGLVTTTVVNIAVAGSGTGDVTGIVASASTTDFTVTNGTVTAPARFIFATENGTLLGWAPSVNATNAVTTYADGAGGAVYTGLAVAANAGATQLFAADFRNRKIDIFNAQYVKQDGTGKFADATLPADYSPFNIQALTRAGTTVLAVAYAKRDAVTGEEVPGAGLGAVNIYSTAGALITKLIVPGTQLNAPWGLAVAPADYGTLSGALLVGNFGDGRINGFDITSGTFIHVMADSTGAAIVTPGLWGIAFGNGVRNQPTKVLYLAAGSNGEANGLYARIDLGATAPDIAAPTGVAVTAPAAAASVSGTVPVTANATDNVGVARVVFAVRVGTTTTEIATDTTAPFSVDWNTGTIANGAATLTATAFDAYGNSTASAGVAVTVANVPDTTAPTVALTAPAAGDVSGTVTVSANATDNVGVAQVQFFAGVTQIGADTSAPYSVQWNTTGLAGAQQLTAKAFDGAGNTTTSAAVAVNVVPSTVTLATLQANIFTPRCAGCHSGGGAGLPGSMNLSSTNASFNALVGINSTEVPALKRVQAGDANASYLVRKLEGTQAVGDRMPFGGPFLDQPTIDQVRSWIQAGAAP